MNRRTPLNDRQLSVLRLIGDSNDLSGSDHEGHRISGRALASRGLVTVSRRGGKWAAAITTAGRHYLNHGCYPELPSDKGPELKDDPVELALDLIRRLQAAPDKVIRVERPEPAIRGLYRRALHAAHAQSLIPEGHLLQHTGRDQGDIVIRLADKTDPDDTTWNRIRLNIRRKTTFPSEISAALASNTGWCQVSEAARDNALALARCLVTEAHAAGHTIELNTKSRARLLLTILGIKREMHIREEYEKTPHKSTPEEIRANRRNPWINRIPEFDSVPSGKLQFTMQRTRDKQDEWTGLVPANFTARVRRMLHDIETANEIEMKQREEERREQQERMRQWREEQDERDREQRRQAEEKKQRWDKAMAVAREQAVAEIRHATFRSAFAAWVHAAEIRQFCTVLECSEHSVTGTSDLARWIAWGRAQADRIDPTTGSPALAEVSFDIEPQPDDLRMFLGGWSPHHPEMENRPETRQAPPRESDRNPWHQGLRDAKQWRP